MYAELKENHPHGTREYPFCEYHMRYWPHAFQIPVHWHDEVEIIYVRKGPLMVEIDGQKFIGDDGAVYSKAGGAAYDDRPGNTGGLFYISVSDGIHIISDQG